jgi:pilus assembly protein CpaF
VTAITEVQRMESDVITLHDLYDFKIDSVTADRKVVGELRSTGLRPGFTAKFERHGIELPANMGSTEPAAARTLGDLTRTGTG